MRSCLVVVVAAACFEMRPASCQAEGPVWEYPAHSQYNVDGSYNYRVRLYFELSSEEGWFQYGEDNDFMYSGPVTIEPNEWYRWDRNAHQINFPFNATNVFGVVENQYGGSGPWYHVDTLQYVEPPP